MKAKTVEALHGDDIHVSVDEGEIRVQVNDDGEGGIDSTFYLGSLGAIELSRALLRAALEEGVLL